MLTEALLGEAYMRLERTDAAIGPLQSALELAKEAQNRLESQGAPEGSAGSILGEYVGMHTLALLADANAAQGKNLEAVRVIESYQSHSLHRSLSARGRPGSDASAVMNIRDSDILEWARSFEFGLVTWVVGADSTVVACVSPDGNALALPIGRGRKAIEEAVRRLREATIGGEQPLLLHLLREIRSELLPPEILAQLTKNSRNDRGTTAVPAPWTLGATTDRALRARRRSLRGALHPRCPARSSRAFARRAFAAPREHDLDSAWKSC